MAYLLNFLLLALFPSRTLNTVKVSTFSFSFDDYEKEFGGEDDDFGFGNDEDDEDNWFPGDDENGDEFGGFGDDEDYNY